MPYIKCPFCGGEFYRKPSRPDIKYCSLICRSRASNVALTCLNCGQNFTVMKSREKTAKFCSRECYNNYHSITRKCKECGKDFTFAKYQLKTEKRSFCSVKCANKYLFKGKPFTKKHRQRISKALTGKPKDKEHIEKMRESRKGQRCSPATEFKKGQIPWCKGKTNIFSKETIQKMRKRRIEMNLKMLKQRTDIELLLEKELQKRDLVFETQKPVAHICIPDFIFPSEKVIVQADGDYWHSLPKMAEKDRRQDKELQKLNWKVLRFKGSQIRNNVTQCVNIIEKELFK